MQAPNHHTIHVHTRFAIGNVDLRVFGGFVEHMGRCVHEGIYDPDSEQADEHGCRTDVLAALRPLGFTLMRYPGGNFVSGYRWEDGVGPVDERPECHDSAWNQTEPNTFGTDEFRALAAREGWEPMMAVNLGTRGAEEAAALVEYVNGRPEPHGVRTRCLGNEMDGPWQIGHCDASEYAARALSAGRAMRAVDPDLELVVCGSSMSVLPTYLE
jgi:alpha-N-arabinofuranosidase